MAKLVRSLALVSALILCIWTSGANAQSPSWIEDSPYEMCNLCSVSADPLGEPCFYWGQPCAGDSGCVCGLCGFQPACFNP